MATNQGTTISANFIPFLSSRAHLWGLTCKSLLIHSYFHFILSLRKYKCIVLPSSVLTLLSSPVRVLVSNPKPTLRERVWGREYNNAALSSFLWALHVRRGIRNSELAESSFLSLPLPSPPRLSFFSDESSSTTRRVVVVGSKVGSFPASLFLNGAFISSCRRTGFVPVTATVEFAAWFYLQRKEASQLPKKTEQRFVKWQPRSVVHLSQSSTKWDVK